MGCQSSGPSRLVKVGELAELTGKSIRTLHYYEELGLLRPAKRSEGGFRLYDETLSVSTIRSISRLQDLDIPLNRIREMAEAWRGTNAASDAAPRLLEAFRAELAETRSKIEGLTAIEHELVKSIAFLEACTTCSDRPLRDQCSACTREGHLAGDVPEFVSAFLD